MSDRDIDAGSMPMSEIFEQLMNTEVGIICVTRENAEKVWVNFEAGAIGKTVVSGNSRVISLMLDYARVQDLEGPLANFQNVLRDREGVEKMCRSVNRACPEPLSEERFKTVFERWWPSLEAKLDRAQAEHGGAIAPKRSDKDMIPEILKLVRELHGRSASGPTTDDNRFELEHLAQVVHTRLLGELGQLREEFGVPHGSWALIRRPMVTQKVFRYFVRAPTADKVQRAAMRSVARRIKEEEGVAQQIVLQFIEPEEDDVTASDG